MIHPTTSATHPSVDPRGLTLFMGNVCYLGLTPPQYWKPGLKQARLDKMLALGYTPLRYRGMAHPPLKPGEAPKEVLTRSVKATADVVENPTVGEP